MPSLIFSNDPHMRLRNNTEVKTNSKWKKGYETLGSKIFFKKVFDTWFQIPQNEPSELLHALFSCVTKRKLVNIRKRYVNVPPFSCSPWCVSASVSVCASVCVIHVCASVCAKVRRDEMSSSIAPQFITL